MAGRPIFADLESRSTSAASSTRLGLPSPRFQHYDGDIPPTLSPLDAFAAQSRKMAMELDAAAKAGPKRMSRLHPAVVSQQLSQHQSERPRYFRSFSEDTETEILDKRDDGLENSTEITHPKIRPISEYPQLGSVPSLDTDDHEDVFVTPVGQAVLHSHHPLTASSDYFDIRRAESPESSSVPSLSLRDKTVKLVSDIEEPGPLHHNEYRTSITGSIISQPDLAFTLAPPRAAFARPANHSRTPREHSDDDYASSVAGSTFSHPRKFSASSGVSTPQSPQSPFIPTHARSPSLNSEWSARSPQRSRSNLNFSRPLSSTSVNKIQTESPSHPSVDLQRSQPYLSVGGALSPRASFDDVGSETSEGYLAESGTSYTYAKFSLPRGRMVSRNSSVFRGLSAPHFEWQEPMFSGLSTENSSSTRSLDLPLPPPSTLTRNPTSASDSTRPRHQGFSFDFQSARPTTPDQTIANSKSPATPKSEPPTRFPPSRPPVQRATTETGPLKSTMDPELDRSLSNSSKSNSTLRPKSTGTRNTHFMSTEDHLAKGIECHEHGDVKESTYHLRIAAMQNHPTAMLLYALACRHGWGMKANPKEGVQWLRRAMDSAIQEMAEDENAAGSQERTKDLSEKKALKSQFALSIYELGVSHLNGWGIEQDKALALRCFEIAGSWGDPDALTEAGFCYAEGIGCKKDMKKAAKFYRLAEAKGVSMIGNSWIYKEKYNEPEDETGRSPRSRAQSLGGTPAKRRNKSRTRSIFARKKSIQP